MQAVLGIVHLKTYRSLIQAMKHIAIKMIVGLLLIWVVFAFVGDKVKHFMMPERPTETTSPMSELSTPQQTNTINQQIKSTIRRVENKLTEDQLAGCMVTDQGCSCYNKGGKLVKVDKQQCQNYTRDSSVSTHKIITDK